MTTCKFKIFGASSLVLAVAFVSGCRSKMEVTTANPTAAARLGEQSDAFEVIGRSPVVVSPGATVALAGKGFKPGMKIAGFSLASEDTSIPLNVESDSKASFAAPPSGTYGPLALTVQQGTATQKISVFFDDGKTDFPIFNSTADKICAGEKFYDGTGTLTEGTKVCSAGAEATANCQTEGQIGCVTTSAVKATVVADLATKVVTGATVAGVTGSVAPSPVDWSLKPRRSPDWTLKWRSARLWPA